MKRWWAAAALIVICHPAQASEYACFVSDTPQMWLQKSGQHVAVTMEMAVGPDITTPAMLAVGDDGKFALLFKGPDGKTCVMAVGERAVVVPTLTP